MGRRRLIGLMGLREGREGKEEGESADSNQKRKRGGGCLLACGIIAKPVSLGFDVRCKSPERFTVMISG